MGYLIAFSSDLIQKEGKNRDLNQYPLLFLNFTINNYTFLFLSVPPLIFSFERLHGQCSFALLPVQVNWNLRPLYFNSILFFSICPRTGEIAAGIQTRTPCKGIKYYSRNLTSSKEDRYRCCSKSFFSSIQDIELFKNTWQG